MQKIFFSFISLLLFITLSPYTLAAWYEVTGTALIVGSEKDARIKALQDALYKAMVFSRADLGSLSNILPILEEPRDYYQFSQTEVRYIAIKSQRNRAGNLQVTIHVDIYPSATACHVETYKKTLLINNITLHSQQQAVIGQIYSVGKSFSQLLHRQFDQNSQSFVSLGNINYSLDKKDPQKTLMLSQDTGAQYILNGEITDLSATIDKQVLASNIINRQFALNIQVFDGKTGNEIFHKYYRDIGVWPFDKTSQVDTNSARFWSSSYGEVLQRTSRNIMLDVENHLSCKITLPEIVAIFDHQATINLGRIHGVKVGDKLKVWHMSSFNDQNNIPRTKVIESDIIVTVTNVYDQNSQIIIEQNDLAHSIQIGDVLNKI